jgi:hypothetical protein
MDAAGAVDAQHAPTAPWKTAPSAVSHSAHTHPRFGEEEEQNEAINPPYTRNFGHHRSVTNDSDHFGYSP